MKVVALAGGTGSAKILRGLSSLGVEMTVVSNVGDNYWVHGLYVCPDVDIAMYTLGGVASSERGWGIDGDTHRTLAQLGMLGEEVWFALGDRDMATSLVRTKALRDGETLTGVTDALRKAFGVRHRILPVTDQPVETLIRTNEGVEHLQEFWVRDRGRPQVRGVDYKGSSKARCTDEVRGAVLEADRIVVCPANPVTSVMPMLAVPGFRELLVRAEARVTALSPMLGSSAFSGPAGKLMRAVGVRPDSVGVASGYSSFLDTLLVDRSDSRLASGVERLGVACVRTRTRIAGRLDEARLARELLSA